MNHSEVGKYWEANTEAWTKLSRMGCDVFRDHVNTPAFLGNYCLVLDHPLPKAPQFLTCLVRLQFSLFRYWTSHLVRLLCL